MSLTDAAYLLDGVPQGGSSGGLDQLTGDVTAGPGTGSQVATLAANVVDASKLAQATGPGVLGRVTASLGDIGFETVKTTQIADANVTLAKIANLAAAKVLGSIAGTAPPAELTITQVLDLITGTPAAGDILYRDASTWLRLAAGASGLFLKSNGVAAPSWAAAGGSVSVATLTLTAAQIRSLSSSPQAVVAAQGANTIIQPLYASYKTDQVDGFSAPASVNLSLGSTNTDLVATANAIANAASDDLFYAPTNALARTFGTPASAINVALNVKSSADVTGGNAANTVKVLVAYAVITIP